MAIDDLPVEEPVVPEESPEAPEPIVMETRDILDHSSNVIGELSLPEGTDEQIWTSKLEEYARNHALTLPQIIDNALNNAETFGKILVQQFKNENVQMGISVYNKTYDVLKYLHFATHCMESGSLKAALDEIDRLIAEDTEQKTNCLPFVSNERMLIYRNKIADYLLLGSA